MTDGHSALVCPSLSTALRWPVSHLLWLRAGSPVTQTPLCMQPTTGHRTPGPSPGGGQWPIPSHIPDKRAVVTQPNCIPAACGPLIPSAFPWGLTRPRTVKCRSQFGNSGSDISSVTFHLWVWTGPPSLWLSCQRPESWSCLPPVLGFTASPVASVRPTEAHSSRHLLPQLQPGSWRWLSPPSPTPSWSRRS